MSVPPGVVVAGEAPSVRDLTMPVSVSQGDLDRDSQLLYNGASSLKGISPQ
jgi:hypothetical protein